MKQRQPASVESGAARRSGAVSVRPRGIQAKLIVSQPGDRFEREADRVAHAVTHGEAVPQLANGGAAENLQRACAACEEEEKKRSNDIQRKAQGPGEVAPAAQSHVDQAITGGQPLPYRSRTTFEQRIRHDFRDVRVHTDSRAAESAREMQALAYTRGKNIVFGAGQYNPDTASGRQLLAHELTHVVQQTGSQSGNAPNVQRVGDPAQAPKDLACDIATTSAANVFSDLYFPISSNVLDEESVAKVAGFIATWEQAGGDDPVRVDGFASTDGPEPLNWTLSCNRAQAVVRELEHPASGAPGIPSRFITEVFANGETDQFSPAPELNRRATIAADLTAPPACEHPGVLRTLDLQPVFLRTDPADVSPTGTTWTARLAEANRIWGKVGVSFIELSPVTIDTPLKATGGTNAEIAAIRALRSAAGVEIFLVDNDMAASGGAATGFDPATNTGCGPAGNVVMSDRGTSNTLLAHELGHVLGLDHPTDLPPLNPGDPNTILEPSGSNSAPNPTRNTMVNFSRILCPDPSGSTCLNPDP
jgi:outer membrane protein OmpA-like peptidoglycan-associated protein